MATTKKTLVMTGATSGIGLAALDDLLAQGHRVVVGARRPGEFAREGLDPTDVLHLDLASLESVRAFAAACPDAIDGLIANAGLQIMHGTRHTEDGYETTFAVNHLAHLLLTLELMPRLTPGGRVVFTASGTHNPDDRIAKMFGFKGGKYTGVDRLIEGDVGDVGAARVVGMTRYATSKLANIMTAHELATRVDPSRASFFTYDPGLVPATGLARHQPGPLRLMYRAMAPLLERLPGASTPARSGAGLAWLATSAELDGRTGEHLEFTHGPAQIWPGALDTRACRALFDDSAALVGAPGL